MIAFDLNCSQGHVFEGWFDSAQAFEDQKAQGLVTCPVCSEGEVTKVLSPIRSLASRQDTPPEKPAQPVDDQNQALKAQHFIREVKEFLTTNFEDVGANFAKEALKIHYGAEPSRNIRGSSTEAEEEMLRDEGIQFLKVPLPKDLD